LVVPTDVRDPSSVRLLFTQAEEVLGRLDLLFNNAGIAAPSTLLEDLTCEWETDFMAVVKALRGKLFL